MANLIEDLYNSTTEIDPAIDKITTQQFSSFYSQFKDFDVITKFLSYRTTNQLNFLKQFDSTSKIFPVILRYNLGLPKLVSIQHIAASEQPVYKYITKRGSKSLFMNIAEEQGLNNLEQLVLTSLDPVTIRGADTKLKYGSQILNLNISDVDLIKSEDLPQKLPIYSSQQIVDLHAQYKFNIIIKSLLFDQSDILNDVDLASGLTLKELILTYLTLDQVIHKNIADAHIHYFTKYDILIPTNVIEFKKYLKMKYPDFSRLTVKNQWTIIKSIMNDFPKYKSAFRVSTGNSTLDSAMNDDFEQGHFITDLNLWIYSKYHVNRKFKTPIEFSALDDFNDDYYKNYYYQITSTLRYLQRTGENTTLYGNLLTYLSENTLHDVILNDFAIVQTAIANLLNNHFELDVVENYELSIFHYNSFANNFIDYYPMNVVLVQPSYTIRHASAIICTSTMSKYTNIKKYLDHSNIMLKAKHNMTTISKHLSNFKYLYNSIASITNTKSIVIQFKDILFSADQTGIIGPSTIYFKHVTLRKLFFEHHIVFEHSAEETTTTYVNYKQYIRLRELNWHVLQQGTYNTEIEIITESLQGMYPTSTVLEFVYSSRSESINLEYSEIVLQNKSSGILTNKITTLIQLISTYHFAVILDVNTYLELAFKNRLSTIDKNSKIIINYLQRTTTVFPESTIEVNHIMLKILPLDSIIEFDYDKTHVAYDYKINDSIHLTSERTLSGDLTILKDTNIEIENTWNSITTSSIESEIDFNHSEEEE